MTATPRAGFVPADYVTTAHRDEPIPIGHRLPADSSSSQSDEWGPRDTAGHAADGRVLGRSSGAAANAPDRLTALGQAQLTSERLRRYKAAQTAHSYLAA